MGRFLAEAAQSILLLGVIGWVGRGFVRRQLMERQARVAADLAATEAAEQECARMREEAAAVAARATQEAPGILSAAKEQAEKDRQAAIAQVEAEARQLVTQAEQTVESEKSRVVREASDRLTRLTAETARRYLDEILTESQRRALIQKAILDSLEEMAKGTPPRNAGVT